MEAMKACRIAGVPYKTADYWARVGGLSPTTAARGKGSRRAYTFADVVGLRLAVRMREALVPLNVVAAAVAHVRARRGLDPDARLPGVWLAVTSDGERVFELRRGAAFPHVRTNANCIHLVSFGEIVADVAARYRADHESQSPPARPRRVASLRAGIRYR